MTRALCPTVFYPNDDMAVSNLMKTNTTVKSFHYQIRGAYWFLATQLKHSPCLSILMGLICDA